MYLTPSHQNPVIYLIANVTQSSSQTRCDRPHLFWLIFGVCLLPRDAEASSSDGIGTKYLGVGGGWGGAYNSSSKMVGKK